MYTSTLFETASWLCLGCMAVPVALLLYGIMAQAMDKKRIDWRAWVIDLISMTGGGLLTALTDETIQMFSDGRSSQLTDVWLDFSGVCSGVFAALLVLTFFHMMKWFILHDMEG